MKTSRKVIEFYLTSSQKIDVVITKKRMKNMRLSISKLGVVSVSIPHSTTYAYAYQFLMRKRDWIVDQLIKINANIKNNGCLFKDDGYIFLLGSKHNLNVCLDTKNKVCLNIVSPQDLLTGNPLNFTIHTKQLNENYVSEIFKKWCKKYFINFFTIRLNYFYSQMFGDDNVPLIKIKAMKSMWGNCNFVKRVVTLNIYLAKAPIECIDYVIIHELCHLTHHNHSKDFYNLLTSLMPDWKMRKKRLNNYSLMF